MLRMSLHANADLRNSDETAGYPYSYSQIIKHLRNFKYNNEYMQVDSHSPKSKVQLVYGGEGALFYPHQYKIKMGQVEATRTKPEWPATKCDEWWTANQFGAEAMQNSGIPARKIHVYEHGVDSEVWTPKLRGQNKKVRFLQVDAGQPRKRADLSIKAFIAAFEGKDDYYLTLKYSYTKDVDLRETNFKLCNTAWAKKHISHITETYSLDDLVTMHHHHDVMVYPSEGEGFGLIPLQALVTGMPVISTSRWCSYDKYFKDNIVDSKFGAPVIKENYIRYGEVVLADLDSLIYQMKKTAENITQQSQYFYNQVPEVAADYNWQTRTDDAFGKLVNRLGADMFTSYRGYL